MIFSGYITSPNPKDIADSIQKLFLNKNRAKDFGENGYNSIKSITWENAIYKLSQAFRDLR